MGDRFEDIIYPLPQLSFFHWDEDRASSDRRPSITDSSPGFCASVPVYVVVIDDCPTMFLFVFTSLPTKSAWERKKNPSLANYANGKEMVSLSH